MRRLAAGIRNPPATGQSVLATAGEFRYVAALLTGARP